MADKESQFDTKDSSGSVHVEHVEQPTGADGVYRDAIDDTATVRGLKARHIQLIGIGAAVGTGLFIGSARSLIWAGPLGSLLAYSIYSAVIWGVCLGAGEMAAFLPIRGGHIAWAGIFVDPAASFALGWNFFYAATMFGCADIIAVAGLCDYWWPDINVAVWITVSLVIITLLNIFHVKFFGEAEFYAASGKVILITMMIVMTFIVMLGGNPKHDRIGFRYWKNPGVWAEYHTTGPLGRFLGFWQVFKMAAFSIGGPDTMALCAAEAVHPRRTLPRATKSIVFRLAVFFFGGVLAIGILVPYNDPVLKDAVANGIGSNASAFVVGMRRVGIRYLPDIFNAMVITSALSCSNGFAYLGTRLLHSLASRGEAPKIFARTTKQGVPLFAFAAVFAIFCLSYMQVSNNGAIVFGWFINLSSVASLLNYIGMSYMTIRFRQGLKLQGYVAKDFLPWSTRWTYPYAFVSLVMLSIIVLTQGWVVFTKGGWDTQEFFTCYFGIAFFVVAYVFWKFKAKTKFVRLDEIDFMARVAEFDRLEEYYQEHPIRSRTLWGRILDKMF